ncbi:hypothetical protein IVB55_25760 [Bradyrhizobium sp. CW4]|nr:hypothetical protein [Bradyrhizobium sp. CW4]
MSDQRAGSPDGIDSVTGLEYFQFADRTVAGSSLVLPIVIEAFGSTKLEQIGSNYFLDPVSGGTGPSIKLAGTPFAASTQVGAWTPIGAEQTANGYQIAWKVIGADQYAVWNADSNGNYVSSASAVVAGGSAIVEAFESSFQQDLNADGVIGIPAGIANAVEAAGSTKLDQIGSYYFLDPASGGTGPSIKLAGTPFAASTQVGAWTPIGAEQTANGYQIAWKVIGADQYAVWNADSKGNYIADVVGGVSGASSALKGLETNFHQDLNGDGVIGGGTSLIEAFGSSLAENNPNSISNSTESAPKYESAATLARQFEGWNPIKLEQTATGNGGAWKVSETDQYNSRDAGSSGNPISDKIGVTSFSHPALETLGLSFPQDFTGNGVDCVPTLVTAQGDQMPVTPTPTSPGMGMAGGNDFFVHYDTINGGGAIAKSTEIVAPEGSTIVAICKQLTELLQESQGNQSHAFFQSACDFHDAAMGRDLIELHIADLNAGYFVVR